MTYKIHAAASSLLLLFNVTYLGASAEIKLTGRKDLVLSYETRVNVLDVAGRYLSQKDDSFLADSKEAASPFSFEQPVKVVAQGDSMVEEPVVEKVINYDDGSVLSAVAANFSKQVRGTLARGSTSYLQMNGGNMIKPGTSFPVSIPQAKGQTFKIIVSEISSNSYTLKLGDAEQTVSLEGTNARGSNSIKIE